MNPVRFAEFFHESYERLAPQYGYETRPETRVFRPESPNGALMIAVCEEVLARIGMLDAPPNYSPPGTWKGDVYYPTSGQMYGTEPMTLTEIKGAAAGVPLPAIEADARPLPPTDHLWKSLPKTFLSEGKEAQS